MDADMLCRTDITKLKTRKNVSVSVIQHSRRFEWPSLMYFNNARCKHLTIDRIQNGTPHDLSWAESVDAIDLKWNHLVGYDKPNPDAKIVHFTQGIPAFKETWNCEFADEWRKELDATRSTVSWEDIMGGSVHKKAMGL